MTHYAKALVGAIATTIALSAPASADQFIVTLSQPLGAVSGSLLATLKSRIVEEFSHDGQEFVVIDAPDEAYLEALFKTTAARPLALRELAVDWSGEAMASIDTVSRMRFGTDVHCAFCS